MSGVKQKTNPKMGALYMAFCRPEYGNKISREQKEA